MTTDFRYKATKRTLRVDFRCVDELFYCLFVLVFLEVGERHREPTDHTIQLEEVHVESVELAKRHPILVPGPLIQEPPGCSLKTAQILRQHITLPTIAKI